MKKLYIHKFRTSIGWIRVASTEKGLALVSFGRNSKAQFESAIEKDYKDYYVATGGGENKKAEGQIEAYLAGRLKKFRLKLDMRGTPFQKKALRKVASIPYGKVLTYGQVAAAIGNPKASRAVGMANARNRLPIVIPCHRVVASNGPGGFGGEIELKKRLLNIEGVEI